MSIVVENAPESVVEQVTEPVEETVVQENAAIEEGGDSPTETQEAEDVTLTIPEKYAGKTVEDLIKMHEHAQKLVGRQGRELGDQRKLINQLVDAQSQATQATETAEEPVSFEDDFYSDPAQAVRKEIENHPEILKAKEANIQAMHNANLTKLEATYPDFENIVADKGFQDWVGKSQIRMQLFRDADKNYDFNAANELLGTWKQISMIDKTQEVKKAEKVKREKALRQTSSESRSSGDSVGGKKIYRRSDLINLQISDPSRYAQLADEIQAAYAEGRVK